MASSSSKVKRGKDEECRENDLSSQYMSSKDILNLLDVFRKQKGELAKSLDLPRLVRAIAFHYWGEGIGQMIAWNRACKASDQRIYALLKGEQVLFEGGGRGDTGSFGKIESAMEPVTVLSRCKKNRIGGRVGDDFEVFKLMRSSCSMGLVMYRDGKPQRKCIESTRRNIYYCGAVAGARETLSPFETPPETERKMKRWREVQEKNGTSHVLFWEPPEPDDRNAWLRKYTVVGKLGHGSFGQVFVGVNTEGDGKDTVAIKIANMKGAACIRREFEILRKITEKNIPFAVRLVEDEILEENITKYRILVMERCSTTSITDFVLGKDGRLLDNIASIVGQILTCIDHCSEHQILHCDLKPANVLFNRGSGGGRRALHVRIIDWGLSRDLSDCKDDDDWTFGKKIGTNHWRAPELLAGAKTIGSYKKIDVWGAGCILVYLLTGANPFKPETLARNDAGRIKPDAELENILRVLGTSNSPWSLPDRNDIPEERNWARCRERTENRGKLKFHLKNNEKLREVLNALLHCDPSKRTTAASALKAPIFRPSASAGVATRTGQKRPPGS